MKESEVTPVADSLRATYRAQYPELSAKLGMFDAHAYFNANPDVAESARSSEDLIRHFCEFGHRECRIHAVGLTLEAVFSEAYPHLAGRLRSFDPAAYRRANRDVGDPSSTARDFFEHYCRHGAGELRAIRDDGRVPFRRDAVRQATGRHSEAGIIAYAHIFFAEPGRALMPYLRTLSAMGGRLALSMSDVTFSPQEREAYAHAVSADGDNDATFTSAPAEGRDWGGFHRLWQRFPPKGDSAVFFLHSKKSQHMPLVVGEMWRQELLGPLCGSYGAVLATLDKLASGHSMVGAALHRSRNIGPSRSLIAELLPLLHLGPDIEDCDFVAGSMFAVRGQVLNEFFASLAGVLDFGRRSREGSPFDGSMAHACERLIGYFASARGKGIAWVL
jgi:hypothetical protein